MAVVCLGAAVTYEEFNAKTAGINHAPRGMFFSEVYLFTLICRQQGVERIVESGVRNGVSTRLLRALWPHVESVELRPDRCPDDLRASLIAGDGSVLVPALAAGHAPAKVGVLIDGPKRQAGHDLRAACLALPNVVVVGQHDVTPGRGERFHSYDHAFRAGIGDALDARIDPAIRAMYPAGCAGLGVWVA